MQRLSYFASKTLVVIAAVWVMLVVIFAVPVQATSRTNMLENVGKIYYNDSIWNFERAQAYRESVTEVLPKLEALRLKMVAAGMLEDRVIDIDFLDLENGVDEPEESILLEENSSCFAEFLNSKGFAQEFTAENCYQIYIISQNNITPDNLIDAMTKLTELHSGEVLKIESLDYELKNELQVRDLMEDIEPTKFRTTKLVLIGLAIISLVGSAIFLVYFSKKHYIK